MSKKNLNNMYVADSNAQLKTETQKKSNYYQDLFGMVTYKSVITPTSVIISYGIGDDFVRVQIDDKRIYKYTIKSAGKKNIEKMKELIEQGKLDEFMDDEVLANLYDRREV